MDIREELQDLENEASGVVARSAHGRLFSFLIRKQSAWRQRIQKNTGLLSHGGAEHLSKKRRAYIHAGL
jgi:hypothetical protein